MQFLGEHFGTCRSSAQGDCGPLCALCKMHYSRFDGDRRLVKRKRRERGASLIEFALVFIPTIGVLTMAINIAWVFFGWACIQQAVREGVRYGITGPVSTGLDAAIKQFVTNMSIGFINSGNNPVITVQYFSPSTMTNITGQSGATQSGNVLKVTASISVQSLLPLWQPNGAHWGTFQMWAPTLAAASADVLETGTPPPSE